MKRRIEWLFADAHHRQQGRKLITGLALALFVPALYLAAAARPSSPQAIPWPRDEKIHSLSASDAVALESALQASPEDLNTRMELVVYYAMHGQDLPFTNQLLWFIKNHPEVGTLTMGVGMFHPSRSLSQASQEQIQAAWEKAIAEHPDSSAVLYNAANWLSRTDPERGLDLLRKAETLDPSAKRLDCTRAIAAIYTGAELQEMVSDAHLNNMQMSDETAARLRRQVEESSDPALLTEVGNLLVGLHLPLDSEDRFRRGLDLIRRAIQLDPGNSKWTEALEAAEAEPQRKANYDRLAHQNPVQRGSVRIGAGVAEQNLINKVDPVYPPLALAAGVQGVVEFTVTVGTDGRVTNMQLVRGAPLLVNAAKEAVLQRIYHPAKVDGEPIPFETQVLVPFRIEQ